MNIQEKSFFQSRLQRLVAGLIFPANQGDWYEKKGYKAETEKDLDAFDAFVKAQQRPGAHYYRQIQDLTLSRHSVKSKLGSGKDCQIEVMTTKPSVRLTFEKMTKHKKAKVAKPGKDKHIIYFPGANTYYQACFRDITAAAKKTGATVHAFNFPGTGASTGVVSDSSDVINAGIAVLRDLIENQGIHIDDIIMQGDCYGSAIAYEVKKEFEKQSGKQIRIIMNNTFSSFEAAISDMIKESYWIPNFLVKYIHSLLTWVGWDLRPGDDYDGISPYQCHIQHDGDQTLRTASLSEALQKKLHRPEFIPPCQDENFQTAKQRLAQTHIVRVKPSAEKRLGDKFGRNADGRVNGHFADLCELEMLDGQGVYRGFVNRFLGASNEYISRHPQSMSDYKAPRFLNQTHQSSNLTSTQREKFRYLEQGFDKLLAEQSTRRQTYEEQYPEEDGLNHNHVQQNAGPCVA